MILIWLSRAFDFDCNKWHFICRSAQDPLCLICRSHYTFMQIKLSSSQCSVLILLL